MSHCESLCPVGLIAVSKFDSQNPHQRRVCLLSSDFYTCTHVCVHTTNNTYTLKYLQGVRLSLGNWPLRQGHHVTS